MTGQDFLDRLDALARDLQTNGKGQTVNIMFRNPNGTPNVLPLSSDAGGVVNVAEYAAVETYITNLGDLADEYDVRFATVKAASEAFKTAQAPHEALMTAAANARKALNDALEADPAYQTAKAALDTARADAAYIAARDAYDSGNVSENFAELSSVKGKYAVGA